MKNKRLMTILGLLAVLAIGGIVYSSLNSKGEFTVLCVQHIVGP